MRILQKQLSIGGMTCINCQNRIERALRHTAGIQAASVSFADSTADITYDADMITWNDIISVIESLDYEVVAERRSRFADLERTVCLLVIIVSLYILLQQTGILNRLAPSQLANSQMGYGMLFVIGVITSVHCIAMCGGINLSQCLPQTAASQDSSRLSALLPALLYNSGRVISYTVIGFILGAAGLLLDGGSGNGVSVLLQGILKLIAGCFMVIMGLNMLNLFPVLRKFSLRMPGSVAVKIGSRKAAEKRPLIVGLLNGLMPCGPLQSMQLVALASGNPVTGALSMLLFSLGTVPLMLGLGSVVSILGRKFTQKVMNIGAVLVVVLGLAMLSQGGSLSGLLLPDRLMALILFACILGVITSIPFRNSLWKAAGAAAAAAVLVCSFMFFDNRIASVNPDAGELQAAADSGISDGIQVINSTLTPGKYPNITVQAGTPVKWVIDAPAGSINGCNYKMLLPKYQMEHVFTEGENIIEFTPEETGTISYTCWMGMIRGNIFVMPADTAAAQTADSRTAITDNTNTDETAASEAGSQEEYAAASDTVPVDVPVPSGYQIPTDQLAIAQPSSDQNGNPVQEVHIKLTDEGFEPAVVVVQKNQPLLWYIEVASSKTPYGTELLVPEQSTRLTLSPGENSLYLYPLYDFDVSDGSQKFHAYLKVVEQLDDIDEAAIRQEVKEFEPLIYPDSIFLSPGMSCCT